MIKIIDDFFEDILFTNIKNYIVSEINFKPKYLEGTTEKTQENFYGNRFKLLGNLELRSIFIKQSEKKFNIKIDTLDDESGIDIRNLDHFVPHIDTSFSKMNILIMMKGPTAVTNGTVFYTDNKLDMHIGFRENRAIMFPSDKLHSPHASNTPNLKRYTVSLFIQEYSTKMNKM